MFVMRFAGEVPSAELCEKKFFVAISVECERAAVFKMFEPEPVATKGCLFGLIALDLQEE